jgi:PTS system nitrogen regulatory IIA component
VKLTVREAATMLNVSETKIYRLIDDEEIPFVMIHHHPMFHRIELLEWAMSMELPVSVDLYEDEHDQPFTTALERGGGRMLGDCLADLAVDLPIESASDRDVIRAVIAARDSEMFVDRAADSIAIPQARSPIICPETPPMVMLWWCGPRTLVVNNVPTNVLFLVIAPTIKQHLQLLSRLSLALHDSAFRAAVQRSGAFDQVVAEARRWELDVEAAPSASHRAAR